MTDLLTIKVGRKEYTITEHDRFVDNGACIQLISQRGPFDGWHFKSIALPKREVNRINKFRRIELKSEHGMVTFRLGPIEKVALVKNVSTVRKT